MLKVYAVDDYDLYVASSFEDAVKLAMDDTGSSRDDYSETEEPLTLKALESFTYLPEGDPNKDSCSIQDEINRQISSGEWSAGFFASTEY